MSFLFAALLANTAPAISTVTVPPAPVVAMSPSGRPQARTLSVDVVIRHGTTLLWQGKLALSSAAGASFSQRRDQSVACTAPDGSATTARFATAYQLSLSPGYDQRSPTIMRLSARLDRPMADSPLVSLCSEQGQRGVEIQSTIDLASDRPATFTADGGFSVTITPG